MIKSLNGGSGATLIVKDGVLVKEENSKRLIEQALKQIHFYNTCAPFKIPKILSIKQSLDKFSISMEYIENAKEIEDDLSLRHFSALSAFFNITLSTSIDSYISKHIFSTKLSSINLPDNLRKKSEQYLSLYPDNLHYLFGINHGDFTTKNILWDGVNYWLIDFLNSFIDSPLQDYTKLFQELIFKDIDIKPYIDALNLHNKIKHYKDFINLSSLFNFLRMYPYLKDENLKNKVSQIIMEQRWIIV